MRHFEHFCPTVGRGHIVSRPCKTLPRGCAASNGSGLIIVFRIIEIAKESLKNQKAENAGSDVKKVWKCINTFLKKAPKKSSCLPAKLMTSDNSIEITNPQSIADNLNKHFVNKGPKLASKLPVSNVSVLEGMGAPNPSSMEFHEIGTDEIVNHWFSHYFQCYIISSLNPLW